MAILIANIGKSDLAVKIDGYYIPVGFDRNEPNEPNPDDSGLSEDERIVWEREMRESYIASVLCPELGVPVQGGRFFSFRDLTAKLLEAYESDPENWHERIRPGRIWGVIKKAHEHDDFPVKNAYIFVTDQPKYVLNQAGQERPNPGYSTDSIHLFGILKKWLEREMPELNLHAKVIPQEIAAIDSDGLLNYYYKFFCLPEIKDSGVILISIKGGTPQMRTALQLQAIASSVTKQLFIDPQLSLKNILHGEPSECKWTSYWRYMRTQKYEDVKILLETRWDFKGAIKILERWKQTLSFLKKYTDDKNLLSSNEELISRIIKTLDIGDSCLNLDIQSVRDFLQDNPHLQQELSQNLVKEVENYDSALNLYTQCRIYYQLEQAAILRFLMSSFYEAVLGKIARHLGQNNECRNIEGRLNKREFLDRGVRQRNLAEEREAWIEVLGLLKSLDYWCTQRNSLIFSAGGVSKTRMRALYNAAPGEPAEICHPDRILEVMAQILLTTNLRIVSRDEYRERFVGEKSRHYIYSEVKEWVVDKLMTEGLQ